jgi:hypothetical protein
MFGYVAAFTDSDLRAIYRRGMTIGQLRALATSPRNGGEDVLDTYYTWRSERALTVSKGMAAAAVTFVVAWFVPFLKNEYAGTSVWLVLVVPLLFVAAVLAWSLVATLRLDRIHASYAVSASLLQRLRP